MYLVHTVAVVDQGTLSVPVKKDASMESHKFGNIEKRDGIAITTALRVNAREFVFAPHNSFLYQPPTCSLNYLIQAQDISEWQVHAQGQYQYFHFPALPKQTEAHFPHDTVLRSDFMRHCSSIVSFPASETQWWKLMMCAWSSYNTINYF